MLMLSHEAGANNNDQHGFYSKANAKLDYLSFIGKNNI